jgi:hypothetical protein
MKVGQKAIVRWMSKLVANGASRSTRQQHSTVLRELDVEQLRHVGGGNGGSQSPKGTW